jgi:hypothetical protein
MNNKNNICLLPKGVNLSIVAFAFDRPMAPIEGSTRSSRRAIIYGRGEFFRQHCPADFIEHGRAV